MDSLDCPPSSPSDMARTRNRSPSPDSPHPAPLIKRLKTAHLSTTTTTMTTAESLIDPTTRFSKDLFDHNNIARLHSDYKQVSPFKYAIVEKLFQDDLLRKVKDECLSELSFSTKETDIYKINQTGDLASLDFLSHSQIARLPNLLTLRDALYSLQFRNFLRAVTGCGPLSGKKQDMSVSTYTRGCHLLNHDDVIGTRRVSYILYMPLPHYHLWQKDWGGSLELYPATINQEGQSEPESIPAKSIPPSWNQFLFFQVQPGKSFHSVEEVVIGGDDDARVRLSISGWFHAPQEGEEGYPPVPTVSTSTVQSSREQLSSSSTIFRPYPSQDYYVPDHTLAGDYVAFLSEFLNPVYLQPRTMKALASRFVEESSLELHSFLNNALAEALEPRLRDLDSQDGLGDDRPNRIPPHTAGTTSGWTTKGPPHKWRYCTLKPLPENAKVEVVTPRAHASSANEIMRSLQNELFSSHAFRAWLTIVTRLMPMKYAAEARRFRPGLDYTLATSDDKEARLDVVLGLTPPVREPPADSSSSSDDDGNAASTRGRPGSRQPPTRMKLGNEVHNRGWVTAEWGGWECYMAPHNEEDDPAIYRSSTHKKQKLDAVDTTTNGHIGPSTSNASSSNVDNKDDDDGGGGGPSSRSPSPSHSLDSMHSLDDRMEVHIDMARRADEELEPEPEPEEDSTLLTVQPGYNRLLLVLRDERVMRFVKYVSAAAEGSRWDVCGEYEVGMLEEQDE